MHSNMHALTMAHALIPSHSHMGSGTHNNNILKCVRNFQKPNWHNRKGIKIYNMLLVILIIMNFIIGVATTNGVATIGGGTDPITVNDSSDINDNSDSSCRLDTGCGNDADIIDDNDSNDTSGTSENSTVAANSIMTTAASTPTPAPTTTEGIKFKTLPVKNITNRWPQYWKDFRDWTHITSTFHSWWQKYAHCIEYVWHANCEAYRQATKPSYHYKTFMSMMSDDEPTSLDEPTPIKCHKIEFWGNKTSHMAIYATAWKTWENLKMTQVKFNNKYETMILTPSWEGQLDALVLQTFTCGLGMNTTYTRQWFAPMIYQSWEPLEFAEYNPSTGEIQEIDFGDLDLNSLDLNSLDSDLDLDDGGTNGNSSRDDTGKEDEDVSEEDIRRMLEPRNITREVNETKLEMEPWLISKGIPHLPPPCGNRCPNSFINELRRNNSKVLQHSILCVSDFPNLPFYGNLTPVNITGSEYMQDVPKAFTTEAWEWADWSKILPLGVKHWRQPILLTNILPQPWTLNRQEASWNTCIKPSHICNITIQNSSNCLIWACIYYPADITSAVITSTTGPDVYTRVFYWPHTMQEINVSRNAHQCKHSNTTALFLDYKDINNSLFKSKNGIWIYNGTDKPWKLRYQMNETQRSYVARSKNYKCALRDSQKSFCEYAHFLCSHHMAGLDEFPIPYDVDFNFTNIIRKKETIQEPVSLGRSITMAIHKPAVNIIDAVEEVKYTLPLIEDLNPTHSFLYKGAKKLLSGANIRAYYKTGIDRSIRWFRTLNTSMNQGLQLRHTGFPYYFSSWGVDPIIQKWKEIEWIAHAPRGLNTTFTLDWDIINYLPFLHTTWPDRKPHQGKLLDRGGITRQISENVTKTYKLYTAHFPQGYLYPPPNKTSTVVEAPMIVPDMQTPAKLILFPRIRKVELKVDLQTLAPPPNYCLDTTPSYRLQYTTPLKTGRKPLQLMAVGAFLAGALLGGIMGGGVSAAMIQPIKAELLHIHKLNREVSEAIAAISNSLDALNVLSQQMRAEMEILEKEHRVQQKVTQDQILRNHNGLMCVQYKMTMDKMTRELDTLFIMGLGRRTPEFQTLLNPTANSFCEESLCTLNVLQVFIDNAYAAYHTRPIPQVWRTKLDPWNSLNARWITPIDHFLFITINGTPAYIPQEECYSLGTNVFVYPHMPQTKLTETRLAPTTMTETIQSMGDWTFLVCVNNYTSIDCTNLDTETLNDTITSHELPVGCWMVHNCSVLTKGDQTWITQISVQSTHLYSTPKLFLEDLEQEHYKEFIKKNQEIQKISEHNQKQLDSIHKKIMNAQHTLTRSNQEIHQLVGLIRTNTVIPKSWNQDMKKCSFFDFFARLIQLDFTCTPLVHWWEYFKEALYVVSMVFLLVVFLRLTHRIFRKQKHAKIKKKWKSLGKKM